MNAFSLRREVCFARNCQQTSRRSLLLFGSMWLSWIGDANETPLYYDMLSCCTVEDEAKYVVVETSRYKKICVTVVLTDGAKLPPCVILNLKSWPKEQLPTAVFLKLGCVKRCQGFRGTKMPNGRRVLLVVPNLYVWIKIQLVTFNTNHSITDSTQTIHCCLNPEASWFQRYPFTYSLPEDWPEQPCILIFIKSQHAQMKLCLLSLDYRQPMQSTDWQHSLYLLHAYWYASFQILTQLFVSLWKALSQIMNFRLNGILCSW